MIPRILWQTNNFRCVHRGFHIEDKSFPKFVFERTVGKDAMGVSVWTSSEVDNSTTGPLFQLSRIILESNISI